MKKNLRTIQFIPSVEEGNGTGHLRRCLEMADVINESNRFDGEVSASLLFEELGSHTLSAVDSILAAFASVPVSFETSSTADLTVIDRRESTKGYVESLRMSRVVVGLDESGKGRGFCDYLIDTFPHSDRRSPPNLNIHAVGTPENRRTDPVGSFDSIIVTFGGEDPAGLTPLVCRALTEKMHLPAEKITAVRGPSAGEWALPAGISRLYKPDNLRDLLHRYDLVITSYGLTAYEALASGTAVILVNPSRYHEKLSRMEGFTTAGVRRVRVALLRKILADPAGYYRSIKELKSGLLSRGWNPEEGGPAGTAEKIACLAGSPAQVCPCCGGLPGPAVARFLDRTYYRCSRSKLIFLARFDRNEPTYDEAYFFDEYKAQYGRTYLDDFQHIRSLALPRLKSIKKILRRTGSLLDVGCAYGPFLSAASDAGFEAFGIDIAPSAVEYVSNRLGFPAFVSDFTRNDPASFFDSGSFDCVTMWYVIEHFRDLHGALELAADMVNPGGVFAFSTPNSAGISGKRSIRKFLSSSPTDHFTVWSPFAARRVLRRYGFRVRKIRVTGHHPERFGPLFEKKRLILHNLGMMASRIFRLGDTFEVYATPVPEERRDG